MGILPINYVVDLRKLSSLSKQRTSDVIKTFSQDQDQDLNFNTKTKTKTLKFFQDQDQA